MAGGFRGVPDTGRDIRALGRAASSRSSVDAIGSVAMISRVRWTARTSASTSSRSVSWFIRIAVVVQRDPMNEYRDASAALQGVQYEWPDRQRGRESSTHGVRPGRRRV